MPEKRCFRIGSKLYHYNKGENQVYVYPEYKYDLNKMPNEVIEIIIQNYCDTVIIEEEYTG